MSKSALTEAQRKIYEFLKDKIINRGYAPTVREIGSHFGIRSPNGVMCHLKALEKKGLIVREPNASRAITLLSERTREQETAELLAAANGAMCVDVSSPDAIARMERLARALEPFNA